MRAILFDGRWIAPGMTGVGMVAYRLLLAVPRESRRDMGLILPEGSPYAAQFAGFRIFFSRSALTRHPRTELFEQIFIPWLCYRHGFKSFVSFEGRTPVWHAGFATFAYLHDATFIKYWKFNRAQYSALLFANFLVSKFLATGIVTVSRAAKDELVRIGRIRPGKIHVVHNGDSGLDTVASAPPPAPPARPYLLAVGMGNPRKNLVNLIEGFARFNAPGGRSLVVTGERAAIEKHKAGRNIPGFVNMGFVEDAVLRHLYENAEALIYPSLDEGFGIPLLDAVRFGCPVLCSDIPVFREIMGDRAVFFDPRDPSAIAEAMRLIPQARARADASDTESFTWARAAATLLATVGGKRRKARKAQ